VTNIIFRYYQKGDARQLAKLYNIAFQMNGFGFIRTAKSWLWRFNNAPNFEPESIRIAEDLKERKIVGAVHVSLIEPLMINGKKILCGEINDVACHPKYIKRGIAKGLMEEAISYMKQKGCDASILSADVKGIARQKIYLRLGYIDMIDVNIRVNFPNILKLLKDMPILAFFFPILFMFSKFSRVLYHFLFKINKSFKNISYLIEFNKGHSKFYEYARKLISRYHDFYPFYSDSKINWLRKNVPSRRFHPIYVYIKKDSDIIGGACLNYVNIYNFKYGMKIRFGIVHDLFIDKSVFLNEKELFHGYMFLIGKIMKAANKAKIGLLSIPVCSNDKILNISLKTSCFIKYSSLTLMIKTFNDKIKRLSLKKPALVPSYVLFAYP